MGVIDTEIVLQKPPIKAETRLGAMETACIERIQELQDKMAEKWGLKLVSGYEMEFFLPNVTYEQKYEIEEKIEAKVKAMPKLQGPVGEFHMGELFEAAEKETGKGEFEIVLGKEDDHERITSPLVTPANIAFAAEKLKAAIIDDPKGFTGNDVVFTPVSPLNPDSTLGVHVSLSIREIKNNSLFMDDYSNDNFVALQRNLFKDSMDIQRILLPIMIESDESVKRFKKLEYLEGDVHFDTQSKGGTLNHRAANSDNLSRFEYRYGGADTSPALNVLIAVASVYSSLERSLSKFEEGKSDPALAFNLSTGKFAVSDYAGKMPIYKLDLSKIALEKDMTELHDYPEIKEVFGEKVFNLMTQKEKAFAGLSC